MYHLEDIVVIVGKGQNVHNQIAVARVLKKRGVEVEVLTPGRDFPEDLQEDALLVTGKKIDWPRDDYIFVDGHYIRTTDIVHDRPLYEFAEGGMIIPTPEFVLMSRGALRVNRYRPKPRVINDELCDAVKELYGIPLEFVPCEWGTLEHIDYFTLILPDEKVMIVDPSHSNSPEHFRDYKRVADRYGYHFEVFDGTNQGYHPLNGLVLSDNGHSVVFYDKRATRLQAVLDGFGAEAVPIELPYDESGGKVRCMTNVRGKNRPETSTLLENRTFKGN